MDLRKRLKKMFNNIKKKAELSALCELGLKMVEQRENYEISPDKYVEPSWELALDMITEAIELRRNND